MFLISNVAVIGEITFWTKDVNWTLIRPLQNVLSLFWRSYVHSIFVLCSGVMTRKRLGPVNCWNHSFLDRFWDRNIAEVKNSFFYDFIKSSMSISISWNYFTNRCSIMKYHQHFLNCQVHETKVFGNRKWTLTFNMVHKTKVCKTNIKQL